MKTDTAKNMASGRRLVLIGTRLPELRAALTGSHSGRFARLHDEYLRLRTKELSVEPPAESVTYVGIHVMNLALLRLLTGRPEYLEEVKRWIKVAIGWKEWGHKFLVNVDLSAGWLLWGLGLAYDWLKEDFTAQELSDLKAKLLRQGRFVYDYKRSTMGQGWATNWWQNHNWIDMNGLATAAYALLADADDPCEEAALWAADARDNFLIVFDCLPPDGADYEGVAYWRYGVPWLAAYADLLREREGRNLFAESAFMRETFFYRLYQCAPGFKENFNFGDCHDMHSGHSAALYFKLASEYKIGQARYLADRVLENLKTEHYESGIRPGILPEAGLEYLWFDPSVASESPEQLPTCRFFEDLGLLSWRDSWKPDAAALSIKFGAPGGKFQWKLGHEVARQKGWNVLGLSHQHPDNGAFISFASGARLACDEGYSRELRAAHHNVVTVDGRGYRDEGQNNIWKSTPEDRVATLGYFARDGEFFAICGDSAACYEDELGILKARRTMAGGEGGYFVIIDEMQARAAGNPSDAKSFEWRLHAECPPIEAAPNSFEWLNGPGGMKLVRLAPKRTKNTVVDTVIKAIMTPQEPNVFRVSALKTLVETAEPADSMLFVHVMTAGSAFDAVQLEIRSLPVKDGLGFSVDAGKGLDAWHLTCGDMVHWTCSGARTRSWDGEFHAE